jgi:hypothetical protein
VVALSAHTTAAACPRLLVCLAHALPLLRKCQVRTNSSILRRVTSELSSPAPEFHILDRAPSHVWSMSRLEHITLDYITLGTHHTRNMPRLELGNENALCSERCVAVDCRRYGSPEYVVSRQLEANGMLSFLVVYVILTFHREAPSRNL